MIARYDIIIRALVRGRSGPRDANECEKWLHHFGVSCGFGVGGIDPVELQETYPTKQREEFFDLYVNWSTRMPMSWRVCG